MKTTTILLALGGTLVMAACGASDARHEATLPTPVEARVAVVEEVVQGAAIELHGTVQPSRQAVVSSRVSGPVVAAHASSGDVVRRGQPLLEIQPETAEGQVSQARGGLAQATSALAVAEKNYRRFQALYESDAASEHELDMARTQYEQTLGAVEQARGAVSAAGAVAAEATVRAPFDARVVERMVEVGDLTAPGRPLVRVESRDGRELWLQVREADIGRIAVGESIQVSFDALPELGSVTGTVAEIVPSADPATHSFTVRVDLAGADVHTGIAGRATLSGDAIERLVVPAGAVHRRGGLELAVVLAPDGTTRTRAITAGRELAPGVVEVLSGLDEGEQVLLGLTAPPADGTPVNVTGTVSAPAVAPDETTVTVRDQPEVE